MPERLRKNHVVGTVLLLGTLAALACGDPAGVTVVDSPQLAKGGPGGANPSVSAVDPSYGHRGETLHSVRITGTGFDASAVASWERNGVPDPAITVLATRFVSSSEVQADIAIDADAVLALYDVAVRLAGGKRGVGIERFEVTTAENLGVAAHLYAMSEQGSLVGYDECCNALVFEDGVGVTALDPGQAWGIDPQGAMVLGRYESWPTAWVRQGPGSYLREMLPVTALSVGGNASSAARAADGTLIVGGWDAVAGGAKKNPGAINRAAVWRRAGTSWSAPEIYATPSGLSGSSILDVNPLAQAVGVAGGQQVFVVWDDATTFTLLDGRAEAINDAGTIAVGRRAGLPVFWWRNLITGAWNPTGVVLPGAGGSCADYNFGAWDINSAGLVVGQSCNAKGKGQATLWHLDLSGAQPVVAGPPVGLPGLGNRPTTNSEVSGARAITETAPYVIAGNVAYKTSTLWVRWRLDED